MAELKKLTAEECKWIEKQFQVAVVQPCYKQNTLDRVSEKKLLEPKEIQVSLADFRAEFVGLAEGVYSVLLVVEDSPQSVFYDPLTKKFGACFGPDVNTGEYIDWGFRSDDPIEMYIA
jgi:hypothetical protein